MLNQEDVRFHGNSKADLAVGDARGRQEDVPRSRVKVNDEGDEVVQSENSRMGLLTLTHQNNRKSDF